MAARVPWRTEVLSIVNWRVSELAHLGVEVQTNRYMDAKDVLALEPEIVIVATGGVPDLAWLPGNELITPAWDILSGSAKCQDNVVVYDGTGRHPGLSAAQYLVDQGKNVELILLDDRAAADLDYGERVVWKRELAKREILPKMDWRLISVQHASSARLEKLEAIFTSEMTGKFESMFSDQVVVEHGTQPADELFQDLKQHANNEGKTDLHAFISGGIQVVTEGSGGFELHRIGDASSSRNVAAAMFDALRLCSVM